MSTVKSSSEDLTLNADGSGNDVVIQNNGTETVRVDTSGNVGIGTSSPTYKFQIAAGTDHLITKAVSNLNSNIFFDTQNTSTGASANIVQRLITSNVAGTGTTSADFQKTKAGALNINNNETNSAAYTRFHVGGSEVMRIDSSGNLKFNSGYGSASTAYGCRAWIKFNGAGTVLIYNSANVSSIADLGVGRYSVNFTTAMVDADYAAVSSNSNKDGGCYLPSTTGVNVFVGQVATDSSIISVAIFR